MKTTFEEDGTMTKETEPARWAVGPDGLRFFSSGAAIVEIPMTREQMRSLARDLYRAGQAD